jgi:hypothetical protein
MFNFIIILLIYVLLITSNQACAEIYRWVDTAGNTNFTDNFDSIPNKYKKRVSTEANLPIKIDTKKAESSEINNVYFSTYKQCVDILKNDLAVKYDLPRNQAYRRAILFCDSYFKTNSNSHYNRAYNNLDSNIGR